PLMMNTHAPRTRNGQSRAPEFPSSSFYVTGGTLPRDAPSYVERRADHQLYEALRGGELCYVLHARQMGKSSLMVRTADRLREERGEDYWRAGGGETPPRIGGPVTCAEGGGGGPDRHLHR